MIHTIQLTSCELDVLLSFTNLIAQRAREPTEDKKTTVNPHSIKNDSSRSYNGVKKSIKRLNFKLKKIKEIA